MPPLQLPADLRRPPSADHRAGELWAHLPLPLTEALRQLSREAGTTLFMTLLAGFLVVMARFSGEDEFVVGTAVANRGRREVEGLIGFFVNTLPLRADLGGEPTFRELLARVRQVTLDALAHQDVPFDRMVEELRTAPAGGAAAPSAPLVQVTFMVQNTPMPDLRLPGLRLEEVPAGARFAKFDLSVAVIERPDGLAAAWDYDADLFLRATVERMAHHLHHLLAAAVSDPGRMIWDLPLESGEETAAQLAAFNRDPAPPIPAQAVPASCWWPVT
jgi:non-ribosomal peptide synthetase component F